MIYFKKIALPPILSIAIYFLCMLLTTGEFNVFALVCTIAFAYLVRLLDDLFDYRMDSKEGKAILSKPTLLTLSLILLVIYTALPIIFELYYLLIPVTTLLLICFKHKVFTYLKTLIVPVFIVSLILANFAFTIWAIIFIALLFVGDLIFVILKENKKCS